MGIETAALLGGVAASGIGSLISGRAQNKSAQAANDANAQQRQYINSIGANMMNANQAPSYWQQQLMSGLGNGSIGQQQFMSSAPQYQASLAGTSMAGPASYSAQGYNPAQAQSQGYGASTTDIPGFLNQFLGSSAFAPATASAGQAGVGGFDAKQIQAALSGQPMNVGEQQIDLPGISKLLGQNPGNDALMQLLRADPTKQVGAADTQLQQMAATGNPYNTSDIFGAQQAVNDTNYKRALADTQSSLGSLGARFGSAGQQRTARAAQELTNNQNLLNAQIGMGAHEAAAGRQLQASQQLGTLEDQRRAAYLQAALGSGDLAKAQAQLMLTGGQANQGANLQAQLANQSAGMQSSFANQNALNQIGLANQGAFNQAGMQTQQLGAQASQTNAQLQTQASMANALAKNSQLAQLLGLAGQFQGQNIGAMNQAGEFGAGAANQASIYNTGAQNQASQFGADATNNAALNNAQFAQQTGMFNAGAQNAASQFNAGSQNAASQYNNNALFQQQSQNNAAYSQQTAAMLQALGLGGQMQQGQQGLNAQLLGIMAGQPQAQPNPYAGWLGSGISDIGGLGMMAGLMGNGKAQTNPWGPQLPTNVPGMNYPGLPNSSMQYLPPGMSGFGGQMPSLYPGMMPSSFPGSPFNSPFGSLNNPVLRLTP